MSIKRTFALFMVSIFLAGGSILLKDTGADPAPSRSLVGLSESYNVSFNKPTLYNDYDPNYPANVLENNTWDDVAIVVFLQDMHTTSVKENAGAGSGTADCADIYQALFVPLDEVTLDTGTDQRILLEDFTATWCIYCTAVVGAMERMDHDSSWFPDKYIGIEWHSGGGTYGTGTSLSVATGRRDNDYNIGSGIPRYVIDGMDPWVGGNSDPNHTATESNIKSRINGRIATAKLSIEAKAGHDDTKAWVDFTVTVEDSAFDNIMVEANAVLVQDAFPRRHGANNGAYLGYIANDHKQFRIFDIDGTPPSISGITPSEDSVLAGDVEIKFTAADPDADDAKITSKVEIKKSSSSTWNTLSRTEGKFIWKTADKSGGSYLYPDGDYQIRISCTDYWDETSSRIVNVTVKNPDAPVITLDEASMQADIGGDGKIAGELTIRWIATDDEDDPEDLGVDIYYKRASDAWTLIESGVPNTGEYDWNTMDPRVPDGIKYRVLVKTTDTDMMEAEAGTSFEFAINNPDPPTIELNSLNVPDLELSGSVIVRWNAIDGEGEDQYQNMKVNIEISDDAGEDYDILESGLANTGSRSFDTTKWPDATGYRLRVTIIDSDFMTASAETETFAIYNNDEPVGGFSDPRADDVLTGLYTLKWDASDEEDEPGDLKIDLYYMSSKTGTWETIVRDYPNSGSYDLDTEADLEDGDGTYTFKLVIKDSKGFMSPDYRVTVEVYNPDGPVITAPSGPTKPVSSEATFSWQAIDPDDGETEVLTVNLFYSSDGAQWVPLEVGIVNTGQYKWDVSEMEDGTYSFKVELIDSFDSQYNTEHVFPGIVVDNPDAPTVEFVSSPVLGSNNTGEITLSWEGEDIDDKDTLTYSLYFKAYNAGEWVLISSDMTNTNFVWNTSSLTTGDYELRIVARDSSSGHLTAEEVIGPFQVYVKKVDDGPGPDDDDDDDPIDTGGDGIDPALIAGLIVLALLLVIVVALVLVVVMRRGQQAAPLPPPGGSMPLPPGANQQLPMGGQSALPPANPMSPAQPPKA